MSASAGSSGTSSHHHINATIGSEIFPSTVSDVRVSCFMSYHVTPQRSSQFLAFDKTMIRHYNPETLKQASGTCV